MVDQKNWSYSFYKNQDLKAFISIIFTPGVFDVTESYAVNLVKVKEEEEGQDQIHRQEYEELHLALNALNHSYAHMPFVNLSSPEKEQGGGCSSCAAH